MHKNQKITKSHVRRVVRKTWKLWDAYQSAEYVDDITEKYDRYEDQRMLALRAIATLPENQRGEFELP